MSGYSAKVVLLTEFLKKNKPWVWTEHCQKTFEGLKAAVTKEPVLALPDVSKTFEVHTDSSNFAIGGVLMHDKHPIAFESQDIDEYTGEQMAVFQVNAKAQNLLYNAISGEEYEKISSCDIIKEMWDKLEVTYEGTSKMKEGESIEEMFARFSKIISDLKAFGRKKKTVAFKATTEKPENGIDDDSEALEEDIAMVSRNMDGLMRRYRNTRRGGMPSRRTRQYNEQDKNDGKCYEYGRYGNVQAECPDLKRKVSRGFHKNKSFGSWSDEDNSENEEVANLCFMTILENDMNKLSDCWTDEYASDDECKGDIKNYFMALGETREVRSYNCDRCNELQDILDLTLKESKKIMNELRRLNRKKKDLELKLEDGLGNPKTILILVILTNKDPSKLGYLKESDNSVLQEHHRKSREGKWYLDSACSSHMIGDKNLFKEVTKINGGSVKFGDDSK
ncbi:uncharacterized protein [Nicotiana tomentosiformis]|uniref:uncharacterized protein n=1 Tax=Nicotiana tomentosiformis TaxID=4098 RepID=UPI00388C7CA5